MCVNITPVCAIVKKNPKYSFETAVKFVRIEKKKRKRDNNNVLVLSNVETNERHRCLERHCCLSYAVLYYKRDRLHIYLT